MKLADSPVTVHQFDEFPFYLKRDDQLHAQFSGNKARKFMPLLDQALPNIQTLICYGSAQANSLYSLAALANLRGWQLEFYVDHVPGWLKQNPNGNYRAALALGAQIIETRTLSDLPPKQYIDQYRHPDSHCLMLEEGGRSPIAKQGVTALANELINWIARQPDQPWRVALPSGTGTTALYLHQTLAPHGIEVVTCPCVGDQDYLLEQFDQLIGQTQPVAHNQTPAERYPTIISPSSKHHFGRLYAEDYRIWRQLRAQTEVEFDLLYDPLMWRLLRHWLPTQPDKSLLYIHQGGLLGNESMLARYQRQFGHSLA
ncbi:1-aminocyclopropane-1-carboxylate deaminase/D-cysteine desulfhydrase [Vibrio ostreae]|uniref:1-aminocyclopropane-1-carboxylate deaminase/D-cysteine desulfhydrase n=1 Tax=Vibrio ostreae TaxID=2841925 RepID=A0A975UDM6_9VIBR|nr:1-aminocyclopropane-1-carboxylate deaminase/D-cysteine desulfhydrase [Vibrio ostreae]QXO19017.1 1-aminocyclopropane-1-carboxylate deaminase/D-cysteine desulfhydrase [Vibrio ostreae]